MRTAHTPNTFPGQRLRAVARHLFGQVVAERYLFPPIADFQHEVRGLGHAGRGRRCVVKARGYLAFWRTAAACALLSGRRPTPGTMLNLLSPMLLAVVCLAVLLMAGPLLSISPALWKRLGAARKMEVAILLQLRALLVAIPVAVLFAGFLAYRRKQEQAPIVMAVSILALSLVATVFSLAVMFAVPAANQAFREIVYGAGGYSAPGPSGPAEMTVAELRDARRLAEGNPRGQANYDVHRHQKLALPAAAVVFGLVTIAFGRRRPSSHPILMSALLTIVVTFVYYILLTSGRALALRQTVAPWLGVWGANLILTAVASCVASRRAGRITA